MKLLKHGRVMEEQILEIIRSRRNFSKMAEDITSHIMEFIEWAKTQCRPALHCNKWYVYGSANDEEPFKTSEELYQYWLNNVKHA